MKENKEKELEQQNVKPQESKKDDNSKKKDNKSKKEIDKLLKEKNELNDKVLRINAEMQNMKRRYEEEIANIYKYNGVDFIKKLLPTVDNFERAIKEDDNNLNDELSKFLEGFKMIYSNLKNILSDYGVKEIDCLHQEFNPNTMDAVLTDKDENYESNIVLDVMQKGYIYNDKVIRPAMVKVNE